MKKRNFYPDENMPDPDPEIARRHRVRLIREGLLIPREMREDYDPAEYEPEPKKGLIVVRKVH